MNASQALQLFRRSGETCVLVFTRHARGRMLQRGVSVRDVRSALTNATTVRRSASNQRSDWTVEGPDTVGDDLTLGVILRGGVIVVTVY